MKISSLILRAALLIPLIGCSPQLSNFGKKGAGEKPSPEFIAPQDESIRLGLAGDAPADIARYLMARGAGPAALSPEGNRVAYQSSITGQPQLYVMAKSGGAGQQLTFGNGVTFFHWAPNGQALIYGADNDGNEQESYYMISADGGSERELLPAIGGGFRF